MTETQESSGAVIDGAGDVTELGREAREVLEELLELSGFDVQTSLTETSERILLEVYPEDEDDGRLLIGRGGRTLAAYQFVLNRVVNRFPEGRKPINVSVSGYAEQRKARLEALAGRLANTVRDNQLAVRIQGMNPADRRTVHMSLAEEDGISTYSEEEGIARRLVISSAEEA